MHDRAFRCATARSLRNFFLYRSLLDRALLSVPVRYKISTLVDISKSAMENLVPVLYKISTLVDCGRGRRIPRVPVLYKISTLVDGLIVFLDGDGSRSLQNFYSCRSRQCIDGDTRSRSLQNFYSCRCRL